MKRFILLVAASAMTFAIAAAPGLTPGARACDTNADTPEGSAMNAIQYAETVIHWHQIRKVDAADGDAVVLSKHTEAVDALASAEDLLDAGEWAAAAKQAYRIPEILHY